MTNAEEAKQIRSCLTSGATYKELKDKGFNRRIMYRVAEQLRDEGVEFDPKPRPTEGVHVDVRRALLSGMSYDEVERETGKPRKVIYEVAHRMRNAGHDIRCGYLSGGRSRESTIKMIGRIGNIGEMLCQLDDASFDELSKQPGDTWAEMIANALKKKDPPKRA
jgi:hypothetical protein